jgi:hypothetical protein
VRVGVAVAVVVAAAGCKDRGAPAPSAAGSGTATAAAPVAIDAAPAPDAARVPDAAPPRRTGVPRTPDDLFGSYAAPEDDAGLPAGSEAASACASLDLDKRRYQYQCEAGFVDTGEWTFADGILFYRATREDIMCPEADCPRRKVNDHGARRVRVVGDFVCFDPVDGTPAWPGGKDLGPRVAAEDGGGFPTACFIR